MEEEERSTENIENMQEIILTAVKGSPCYTVCETTNHLIKQTINRSIIYLIN